jgi:NADP-dependent 3-hydroxy acid dehydrogenase YdfG
MKRSFEGRVALITGASGGIGRAIALGYAERGGSVALVGRDRRALDGVQREAEALGARVAAWVADLSQDGAVREMPEKVGASFGQLDVLVHAAGLYTTDALALADPGSLSALWRVNAEAPLVLSIACGDLLRESRGEIVFVNSSVVAGAAAGLAAYAASKRALAAIADSLRATQNENGIRVLSVYPGRTATRMQRQVHELEGRDYRPERLLQPEDVATAVLHALELPRTAEITDLHLRPFQKPA